MSGWTPRITRVLQAKRVASVGVECAAVEVVNLLSGERHAVDGVAVLLVAVVAQPAGDVGVRTLVQVLGGVLGLLAPQRPLDRGGLLLTRLTRTALRVADHGQHGLGDLAFAAVDECELNRAGQVRAALDDLNVCHDGLLGLAGDRGGDLAGAAPSEAQRSDLKASQFAKRASFTRSVKESGPAILGHGKGPPRVSAGPAGLAVLHEGWQPVRVETLGRLQRLDAQRNSPAPNRGDTPRPTQTWHQQHHTVRRHNPHQTVRHQHLEPW